MPYPPNLQPSLGPLARDAIIYTQPLYELARRRRCAIAAMNCRPTEESETR